MSVRPLVQGTIPPSTINGIQETDYSYNNFSGPVPDFESSHQRLFLSFNKLTGTLPSACIWRDWCSRWLDAFQPTCGTG
jgi:hypothetical protein